MKIKYKTGICSGCGKDKLITNKSKNLCTFCNQNRLQKKSKERYNKKVQEGKAIDYKKLDQFYLDFWNAQKEKICYETQQPITTFNKWHIHHLLEKDKHIEYAYNFDNCVLLTLEQHHLWHGLCMEDKAKLMPRTYQKYMEIKEKYLK